MHLVTEHLNTEVLVINDDADLCDSLQEFIGDMGVSARCVFNGQQALELLHGGYRPSVIFLDIHMPVMSGLEFARIFCATPEFQGITLIALSCSSVREMELLHGKVTDVVPLPTGLERLQEFIRHYCLRQ